MSDHTCAPEVIERVYAFAVLRGGELALSREGLAEALSLSPTNAGRATRSLVASGHLDVVRRGTGPGYPTRYRVTGKAAPVNPYAHD